MDDLRRELGRLEIKVAEAAPDSRVIDELATVRGELTRGNTPFPLANLRLASPCKERWADMLGDDRARVCNGCDRPVFNLSEMTRDQAEAVLATRGIKPCVRFYRRADGTVMTSDCPPGARRSRRLTVITAGTLLGAASPAMADPEPTPEPTPDQTPTETESTTTSRVRPDDGWEMGEIAERDPDPIVEASRPAVAWSTWARAGYGIASRPPSFVARSTTAPLMPEGLTIGEGALGVDVTFAIVPRFRLGAWAEVRTVSDPVLGGELIAGGRRSVVLRGGGNGHVITGAFGIGFAAADPYLGHRHVTGARIVTSMTRADVRDWSVTMGLELDPIGALGYIVHRARQ